MFILSIGVFFLWWWFENLFPYFAPVYKIFKDVLGENKTWLVIMLAVWFNFAWDMIISARELINEEKREQRRSN